MMIVFEGIDGAGKSSHLQLICQWLNRIKYNYVVRREPGGTYIAEQMRKLLINYKLNPMMQLLLVSTARLDNTSSLIDYDGLILFDRYIDSTYAYQKNIDKNILDYMINLSAKIKVDYTFLFLNQYRKTIKNHFDEFSDNNSKEIKEIFLNKANLESEKYCVVPDLTQNEQHEFIKAKISEILNIEENRLI